ncbi:MAG TPA: type I-C CRISPR-associated protein Cas5 [Porphyromonadaceae bacterium]|nr:type I-C CRISPR-associated protein Cas5c [Paramuribaculum sp.]HAB40683.1 type I-C CRISPR-associated protein Cas5 [Porphyromonadaceae bacterium]
MIDNNIVKIRVKGDYACFTQPALKVERMTYPCMTPSAARGVLECILWKPEFQWVVRSIRILRPITFSSFKRNELSSIQGTVPIDITATDSNGSPKNRAQRNSVVLRDVEYIIEAAIYMSEKNIQKVKNRDKKEGRKPCEPIVKYRDMFLRRLHKGQCWHQPYLGTREFSCDFFPVTQEDEDRANELNLTYPIGSMLFDIWYDRDYNANPIYMYDTVIRNSTLICPDELNEKMLSTSHLRAKVEEFTNSILFDFNKEEK